MALNGEKRGDEALDRLLAEAGAALDAAAVRELVRGVVAAPPSLERDAWTSLVMPVPGDALSQALTDLKTEIEATATDGLDGGQSDPARLASLRAELKRRGLDGFIVPRIAARHLGSKALRLILGIIELRETVGNLTT